MKNIFFLGGKEIGYFGLKYLLENAGKLNINVSGVLTSNKMITSCGLSFNELCGDHNIKIYNSLDDLLTLTNIDQLISVQYHLILQKKHIEIAREYAINLHMAPLPEYRGCNQFSFAIIDNAKEFGTTLHFLDTTIDGGDVLFEKRFRIPENSFVQDLYQITSEHSRVLLLENLQNVIEGKFNPAPQKELGKFRKSGFHLRNEIHEINRIEDSWNIEKKKRYFRATYFPPFPSPKLIKEGKEIELTMDWYNSL